MKKCKRFIAVGLIVLILTVGLATLFSTTACAEKNNNRTDSSPRTGTVYGITYTYLSRANCFFHMILGSTVVSPSANAPTGYIGEMVRIYQDTGSGTGQLKVATSVVYNTQTISAQSNFIQGGSYAGESNKWYYSCGAVRFYNGNGYTPYYSCSRTPNVGFTGSKKDTARMESKQEWLPAAEKDELIPAEGVHGYFGYVKEADLDGEQPRNPEEAVKYMEQLREDYEAGVVYEIPLYAADGETVLDVFVISYPIFLQGDTWYDLSGNPITVESINVPSD